MVIRSAQTTGDSNGAKMWCKLYQKYNPQTLGRKVRMLVEVAAPPRIAKMEQVE